MIFASLGRVQASLALLLFCKNSTGKAGIFALFRLFFALQSCSACFARKKTRNTLSSQIQPERHLKTKGHEQGGSLSCCRGAWECCCSDAPNDNPAHCCPNCHRETRETNPMMHLWGWFVPM